MIFRFADCFVVSIECWVFWVQGIELFTTLSTTAGDVRPRKGPFCYSSKSYFERWDGKLYYMKGLYSRLGKLICSRFLIEMWNHLHLLSTGCPQAREQTNIKYKCKLVADEFWISRWDEMSQYLIEICGRYHYLWDSTKVCTLYVYTHIYHFLKIIKRRSADGM